MTNQNATARQPRGIPTGGQFAAQDRTEAASELEPGIVEVRFADGSTISAAAGLADRIVGKDAEGRLIAQEVFTDNSVILYTVTSCCFASDKGTDDAIACRGCYRLLDDEEINFSPEPRDVIYPTVSGGGSLPPYTPEQATRAARERLAELAYPHLRYSELVGGSDYDAHVKVRAAAEAIWADWDRRLNLLDADPRIEAGYEALRALSASGATTRQQAIELSAHIADLIHKETQP